MVVFAQNLQTPRGRDSPQFSTVEAAGYVLSELGSPSLTDIPKDVRKKAMEYSVAQGCLNEALRLADQPDSPENLEALIEKLKENKITIENGDTQDRLIGFDYSQTVGNYQADSGAEVGGLYTPREAKVALFLAERVLVPKGRKEEAVEALLATHQFKSAFLIAKQIGVDRVAQLCEDVGGIYKQGIEFAIETKRTDLEQKLKQGHIQGLAKRDKWDTLVALFDEYKTPQSEMEPLIEKGIDYVIGQIGERYGTREDFALDFDAEKVTDIASRLVDKSELSKREERMKRVSEKIAGLPDRKAAVLGLCRLGDYTEALEAMLLRWNGNLINPGIIKFFKNNILNGLPENQRASAVERYAERIVDREDFSLGSADELGIDIDWLKQHYEQKGNHIAVANILRKQGRDSKEIKELYLKAGDYRSAAEMTLDNGEKTGYIFKMIQTSLPPRDSDARTRYTVNDAVRDIRSTVDLFRGKEDLVKPVEVAKGGLKRLMEKKYYIEALRLGIEFGLTDIGSRIPDSALADYERKLDFHACAEIAKAKGLVKRQELYDFVNVQLDSRKRR